MMMMLQLASGECEAFVSYDASAMDNCPVDGTMGIAPANELVGGNGFAGNMFNVSNIGTDGLSVTGFDLNLNIGTWNVEAYYTRNLECRSLLYNNCNYMGRK